MLYANIPKIKLGLIAVSGGCFPDYFCKRQKPLYFFGMLIKRDKEKITGHLLLLQERGAILKRWISLAIVVLTAIIMTSCGDAEHDEPFIWPESIDGQSPFYGETLTVGVHFNASFLDRVARHYEIRNPGVTIEIINMDPNMGVVSIWQADLTGVREDMGVQLMAGTAPILIEGFLVDYLNPMTIPFFADWLPIMEADPNFHEENWHMNVFDAMSRDGRLLGFPIAFDLPFGSSYFTINSTVPGLADEFAGRQYISLADMMEIHSRVSPTLARPMYMTRDFDLLMAVESSIDDFFDFETGRVEFNTPEFINFISHARELTSPGREFAPASMPFFLEVGDRGHMTFSSQRYMFRRVWAVNYESFGVFEEDLFFINPLPYTNQQGELLIAPWRTFALNANATQAQQALALDFLRFVLELRLEPLPEAPLDARLRVLAMHYLYINTSGTYASPLRSGTRFMFEYLPNHYQERFQELGWQPIDGDWPQAFETMITRAEITKEMPMQDTRYAPDVIRNAVREILRQFHDGLITAEQAANDLQNRVTLIIMELD